MEWGIETLAEDQHHNTKHSNNMNCPMDNKSQNQSPATCETKTIKRRLKDAFKVSTVQNGTYSVTKMKTYNKKVTKLS